MSTFFKYWLNTREYYHNTYKYCHNTSKYLVGEYTKWTSLNFDFTIFRFSSTNQFCKGVLPKMLGIGQLDKVEIIKNGKMDKLQSKLTPGVIASYMIH